MKRLTGLWCRERRKRDFHIFKISTTRKWIGGIDCVRGWSYKGGVKAVQSFES